jgi:hypothetical protein
MSHASPPDVALVVADSSTCSVVACQVTADPWPLIATWAKRHRYLPRAPQTATQRMFQRGSGLLVAPMRARFTLEGSRLTIEGWLEVNLFVRFMSLFLLPARMHIRSGGFRAALPRRLARTAMNELLAELRAPLVP